MKINNPRLLKCIKNPATPSMTVREVKDAFGLSSETAIQVRDQAKKMRNDTEGVERRKAKLRKILTRKESANRGILLALATGISVRKAAEMFKKCRASICLTMSQMEEYAELSGISPRSVAKSLMGQDAEAS